MRLVFLKHLFFLGLFLYFVTQQSKFVIDIFDMDKRIQNDSRVNFILEGNNRKLDLTELCHEQNRSKLRSCLHGWHNQLQVKVAHKLYSFEYNQLRLAEMIDLLYSGKSEAPLGLLNRLLSIISPMQRSK